MTSVDPSVYVRSTSVEDLLDCMSSQPYTLPRTAVTAQLMWYQACIKAHQAHSVTLLSPALRAGAMSAETQATLPGSARCAQAAVAEAVAVATVGATATAEEAATGTGTAAAGATGSAALPRAAGAPPTRPRAPGAAPRTSPAPGAAPPTRPHHATAGVPYYPARHGK